MSKDITCDTDPIKNAVSTIAQRVATGRETRNSDGGAIVPFPENLTGKGIIPVLPSDMKQKINLDIWQGYKLTTYAYRSAEGEIIQIVMRLDHTSEPKIIRPVRYRKENARGHVYSMTAIEGFKPLYGLDRLAQRPDAPVLAVEGEKAVEAAQILFPDHVVITWMSGASNVRNTEMIGLEGRQIVLWPDHDEAGRKAMLTFAAFAYAAGAASVTIVDVPREFPEKWDLADELPTKLRDEVTIQSLLSAARRIDPAEVALLASDARQQAEQHRLLGHMPGYTRVPIEEAKTALQLLDADMHAGPWRRVGRCLYYAYGDEGLAEFDAWSRSSEAKYRKGEPAKMWAAFANELVFRADSLAWLFRTAAAVLSQRDKVDEGDKPNVQLDAQAIVIASTEEINDNHAFVVRGGKTGVLWENYDPRFDRYTQTYLSKRDFVDRFVRSIALPKGDDRQTQKKDKRMDQGELWFSSVWRRSYNGVVFAPGKSLESEFLNLWRGFAVNATNDPLRWSHFKQHLLDHVAGGDAASYEYILNWMAFAVQKLEMPIGVALVLIGKKGAGKSIVTELFGRIFGQHMFVTSRMDDVIGRFNDRLETTVLLGLEEAIAPQNKSADGTLKDLITRRSLRLEGKFFGVWDAPNHLRIIVTSNNEHVVRADGSDRRYAVFDVTNPHQASPNERRQYFGLMVEQMENGGYEAMLGELLSRDISAWNPEVIPETEALKRQKVMNLVNDPVKAYLYERLTDGVIITTGEAAMGSPCHRWSETRVVEVPTRDLSADFRLFAMAHGMSFSERQLQNQLARYMPEGFRSMTRRVPDGDASKATERYYPFPPLEVARKRFEEVTGLIIEREK